MTENLDSWETRFEAHLASTGALGGDAAHDRSHVLRVVANAKALVAAEGADPCIVVPAAWLHDCVQVPKHSPDRARASRLAADAAGGYLRGVGYPAEAIPAIEQAIHAHSFSAGVEALTLEAKVVQDADRLDALGAVGIARTMMLGGVLGVPLYDAAEPVPVTRTPEDRQNVLDHFFVKLLRLEERMQTESGRREAARRTAFMREYLAELERELGGGEQDI